MYIGETSAQHVLVAWGTADGERRNTIGRASESHGPATVSLNGDHRVTDRNWLTVRDLKPDTEYPYEVKLRGRLIGKGSVRTMPLAATTLDFFVIGDYGNGSKMQKSVATAMWQEYARLKSERKHVRFVLTVGDNIYADHFLGIPLPKGTGDEDAHWRRKFFDPYEPLLREIPFYATAGNHDGRESESEADLDVLLDNFFYPGDRPALNYRLPAGGLADFFGIDTTANTDVPIESRAKWLEGELAASKAPWKIVFGHHPPYTAGPNHPPSLREMRPFLELFRRYRVAVYFCGHEHNFQVSAAAKEMAPARMILSGAGGELRTGNVLREMRAAQIAAWSPLHHFLHVRIEGDRMMVKPVGPVAVRPVGADGKPVAVPIIINQP